MDEEVEVDERWETSLTRPDNAVAPDVICENCQCPMGEEWGVLFLDWNAGIGNLIAYLPYHATCWPEWMETQRA